MFSWRGTNAQYKSFKVDHLSVNLQQLKTQQE